MASIRLFFLAVAALLAACAGVIPPRAPLPDNATVLQPSARGPFIGVGTPGVAPGEVPGSWWRLYASPTLDGLVQKALAANTDLRVAAANIQKAQAGLDVAHAAQEPTTSISASPTFGRRSAQEELHPGHPFPNKAVYGVGFSASYQVDLFGQIRRSIDAAQADVGAAIAARDAVRVTVAAETTRAYLDLCSAGREIAVANAQVGLQVQSTGLTQKLAAFGRATSVDVERSSVQEQQVRASIPTLAAQRKSALYRLAALTGQAPQDLPKELGECGQEPLLAQAIPLGDGAALLRRRPDVRRAEIEVLGASDRIGVAIGDLYPKIVLGASIASVGANEHAFRDDSFKFSLGPLISWEFPDRARVNARIHAAEADREAALARFDGVVLGALRETETALEVYARDQERRAILQSARDRAQNAAQDTQRLFTAGRVSYLPVLDALRTLNQVEQSLATADSRLATDQVNLFLALGGGWED